MAANSGIVTPPPEEDAPADEQQDDPPRGRATQPRERDIYNEHLNNEIENARRRHARRTTDPGNVQPTLPEETRQNQDFETRFDQLESEIRALQAPAAETRTLQALEVEIRILQADQNALRNRLQEMERLPVEVANRIIAAEETRDVMQEGEIIAAMRWRDELGAVLGQVGDLIARHTVMHGCYCAGNEHRSDDSSSPTVRKRVFRH